MLKDLITSMRSKQWYKNLILFVGNRILYESSECPDVAQRYRRLSPSSACSPEANTLLMTF